MCHESTEVYANIYIKERSFAVASKEKSKRIILIGCNVSKKNTWLFLVWSSFHNLYRGRERGKTNVFVIFNTILNRPIMETSYFLVS